MAKPLNFPNPGFTSAYTDDRQRKLPQCIAHRGFSAQYPENTMAAFRAAIEVGAHALEMDLQMTKDGVLVISHDPTLKSHFGQDGMIAEHDWHQVKDLRTIAKPHEPIPRLIDVLTWLSQPEAKHVWVLLEIKAGNNAKEIMQTANVLLKSTPPVPETKPWNERIVFTVLPGPYLSLLASHIPGFPASHVGFSRPYMRNLLPISGLSFNICIQVLMLPGGSRLITGLQKKHSRQVYTWVARDEEQMIWCIRRGLDGVLCDDPEKFVEVCRGFYSEVREPWMPLSFGAYWQAVLSLFFIAVRAWSMRKVLRST